MKSETQLAIELGLDKRTIKKIRVSRLSRNSWKRFKDSVYYTDVGEHTLRNEIMKKVMSSLDY